MVQVLLGLFPHLEVTLRPPVGGNGSRRLPERMLAAASAGEEDDPSPTPVEEEWAVGSLEDHRLRALREGRGASSHRIR